MSGAPVPTLLALPAAEFAMGSGEQRYPGRRRGPGRDRSPSAPFRIAAHAVTNDEFAAFVDATGYVTDAER